MINKELMDILAPITKEEQAIFDGEFADRDAIGPEHFEKWLNFAKERGMGIDFNPTFFSHPMVKDNLTLSSPDDDVRRFWIEHGKRCLELSAKLTLGVPTYAVGQGEMRINPHFTSFYEFCI